LSLLPVDVPIGKLLLLGSAFATVREAVLTIGAALSVQSPLTKRREGLSASRPQTGSETAAVDTARDGFMSQHGDPFTLLNCFDDWIAAKQHGAGGGGGRRRRGPPGGQESHRWCKRHGLQQNRLYEMAKLKQQFDDLMEKHRLGSTSKDLYRSDGAALSAMDRLDGQVGGGDDSRPGDWTCPQCNSNVFASKMECFRCQTPKPARETQGKGKGKGQGKGKGNGADDRVRRQQLRLMQQEAEKLRGRRVLSLDEDGELAEADEEEGIGGLDLDIRHLDFELSYKALAAPAHAGRAMKQADCNLCKLLVAGSLYPNFAVPVALGVKVILTPPCISH
jgi:hypothetical protein